MIRCPPIFSGKRNAETGDERSRLPRKGTTVMKKIVVLDAGTLGDDLSLAPLNEMGEVTVYRVSPPETVRERITGADAVILNKVKIGEAQLPAEGSPGIICVAATGFDNIDLEACRRHGVAVANVRGYSSESVEDIGRLCGFDNDPCQGRH